MSGDCDAFGAEQQERDELMMSTKTSSSAEPSPLERAAASTLLAMVAADRDWNEGAARTRLLQIFEATGLEDAWVAATRRKLSTILFG